MSLQTVFQIPVPGQKPFHSRRAHKKSRTGCLTCKRRRVKCDEQKPNCHNCLHHGVACSYSAAALESRGLDKPSSLFSGLSLDHLTTHINQALAADSSIVLSTLDDHGASRPLSAVAFHRFLHSSAESITNPAIRQVMTTDVIRVSFKTPYLMYTILAVGMLHLNRLSPDNQPRFVVAEAQCWQQAIRLYQNALSSAVSQENVDGLLSACMLMGIMSLCPEHFEPSDSWVLSDDPSAMNWLCLQSGPRCILDLAKPYIPGSIWFNAFQTTHEEEYQLYDQGPQKGREALDPALADLCGIEDSTTASNSPYYEPLRILHALFGLERNAHNSAQMATFMGRLEQGFIGLLWVRDLPALVILAHWMGLMCLVSEWQQWVEGRIRGECVAICIYLERSGDPAVLNLLKFPAAACGYSGVVSAESR